MASAHGRSDARGGSRMAHSGQRKDGPWRLQWWDQAETRRAYPYTGEGRHDTVDLPPSASLSIRSVREGVPPVVAHWHGAGREAHPTGSRPGSVLRSPHPAHPPTPRRAIAQHGTPQSGRGGHAPCRMRSRRPCWSAHTRDAENIEGVMAIPPQRVECDASFVPKQRRAQAATALFAIPAHTLVP
jgi:hypothetical protein